MITLNVSIDTRIQSEIKGVLETLCYPFGASIKTYEFDGTYSIYMAYQVANKYSSMLQSCVNSILSAYVVQDKVSAYTIFPL